MNSSGCWGRTVATFDPIINKSSSFRFRCLRGRPVTVNPSKFKRYTEGRKSAVLLYDRAMAVIVRTGCFGADDCRPEPSLGVLFFDSCYANPFLLLLNGPDFDGIPVGILNGIHLGIDNTRQTDPATGFD